MSNAAARAHAVSNVGFVARPTSRLLMVVWSTPDFSASASCVSAAFCRACLRVICLTGGIVLLAQYHVKRIVMLTQHWPYCHHGQQLTAFVGAYTAGSVDIIAVRKALALLRKSAWKNNREAAKAVGLGASTVAKIENVKGYPGYDPGIGVIAKLIEGLPHEEGTERLTVWSFLRRIDQRHAIGKAVVPFDREPKGGQHDDRAVPAQAPADEDRVLDLAARIVRIVIDESTRAATDQRPENIRGTKSESKTTSRKSRTRSNNKS